jgi:AcrR family transcriptional regulator
MGVRERKEREKECRRQEIVVAAKRAFSEKGFGRARMEDIAREAELAPATLYIYFRNKEELFATFSLTLLQCLSAKLKNILHGTYAGTAGRLDQLKNAIFEMYLCDPWGFWSFIQVHSNEMIANLSPSFLRRFEEMFQGFNELLTAVFQEGIDQKELINKSPAAMVKIFWTTLSGILLFDKNEDQNKEETFKTELDFAFEILQRGLQRMFFGKDMKDKICCQCSLKPNCSGLRELFAVPELQCAELLAFPNRNRTTGIERSPITSPAGC